MLPGSGLISTGSCLRSRANKQGGDRDGNRGGGGDDVGDSDDYAASCRPHPRFVHGLCSRCGVEKEEEEGGVAPPGVAVGHETMRQGGDGDGDDYAANCPPHPGFVHGVCSRCGAEEAGGGALPGVADGYEVTTQGRRDEDDNDDNDDDEVEDDDDDEGDDDVVTVAYIHGEGPALPALEEATSIVSASDRATLMHERKLILILDLDHTLLNSTSLYDLSPVEQAKGLTPDTFGDPSIDLFRLDIDDLDMLVKLRAFARGFLEQANAIFEMHVYTLGSRVYARAAVGLLDPDGVYIGGRIVSRNESTKQNKKSLDAIQGADPAMVVILDYTDGAWPWHPENLILMDRYHYFASTCRTFDYDIPSLAEQGLEENEHDGSLAVVLGVLQRIHQGFFDGHRADVREVIAEVRSQVLPECTVAFSFLAQVMEDYPEATLTWRMAEALGAVCRKDVDEEVTHVVAEDPAAEKAQWARDNGKFLFLVNTEWVKAASFRWCRQDELAFPVKLLNLP